jgi:cytochrome c biogenesis protein CcdA
MMNEWMLAGVTALWLGVLTSISPCPLATNIAAISYISRRADQTRTALLSGILYTVGRTLTYVVLGVLLTASLLSVPEVSQWLQKSMNRLLGPLLIVVGMFLLELLKLPSGSGSRWAESLRVRAESMGVWGAGLLGILFALTFCPLSAALFFGSLIPLSLSTGSVLLMPALYGIGTAVPVFGFALVISLGAKGIGRAFSRVSMFDKWARLLTGVVFIAVGVYLCMVFVFLA